MKLLLCTLIILATCFSVSIAATWYIKPDGTGDAPTVTFDATNWSVPFTVLVEVNPADDSGSPIVQVFPAQPHTLTEIRGPLTIEGSVILGKDRSLTPAVMLAAAGNFEERV